MAKTAQPSTELTTTTTVTSKDADRVLAAFTSLFGYNAETDGTPEAFFKAQQIKYIKSVVVDYESRVASKDARVKVQKEIDAIGIS